MLAAANLRRSVQGRFLIAVPHLNRIANFDDLDPLAASGVSVEIVPPGRALLLFMTAEQYGPLLIDMRAHLKLLIRDNFGSRDYFAGLAQAVEIGVSDGDPSLDFVDEREGRAGDRHRRHRSRRLRRMDYRSPRQSRRSEDASGSTR